MSTEHPQLYTMNHFCFSTLSQTHQRSELIKRWNRINYWYIYMRNVRVGPYAYKNNSAWEFNQIKCEVFSVTRKRNTEAYSYSLRGCAERSPNATKSTFWQSIFLAGDKFGE